MSDNHTEKDDFSQIAPGVFLGKKFAGETLAMLVTRFRRTLSLSESVPVTYAGRLDPMAQGEMILLLGEACKKKDQWLLHDKVYECTIVFGIATDTYDMLGILTQYAPRKISKEALISVLQAIIGTQSLRYPPYSSKPVDGVPLFHHARAGTLPSDLPVKEGEVYEAILLSLEDKKVESVIDEAVATIEKVVGDFRQEAILTQWASYQNSEDFVTVASVRFTVSSGVYIRSLGVLLGEALGIPAVVTNINRTKIL